MKKKNISIILQVIFITMNADSVSPVTLNLDNASFTNFQAPGDTRQGGVVYTMGDLSINGSNVVSFSENKTGTGGALFGAKAITIDCDEIIFDSNSCYNSGAIRHQGVLDITGSKVTFSNNSARNRGGSIYATSNVKMTGKTEWKLSEILKILDVTGLPFESIF